MTAMTSTTPSRWLWIAPILIYAAATLEMIIMVTPFAAYFYSVYTPLFHGLEQNAATAWLPQFFLPHLAHTKIYVFRGVEWFGAFLALIGLIGFFACAIQLYYGKFIQKKLVTGGLYGRVRHPQYLMLIVGGAGFLFLWPRFFILVTYLMMLGLYYILARHEEETIRKRYGNATDDYLASVAMFNPFRKPQAGGHVPLPRSRALTIWLVLIGASLVLAFGLRTVAVSQLYAVERQAPDVTALSFRAMSDAEIGSIMDSALATGGMRGLLDRQPGIELLMQINDGRSQLTHLLIDLGMKADVRRALELPDDGYFVAVSRVVPRDRNAQDTPGPFSLGSRTEPLALVTLPRGDGDPEVFELAPDDFYPGFARILF
jgi:protein-S-isoprenylcysteine O-methyltransferase Ste14